MIAIDSILVICVGNLCRSPVAGGFLHQLLPEKKISSAGLKANPRLNRDAVTLDVATDLGLDLSNHTPRKLSAGLIEEHDLILVMEKFHQKAVLEKAPTAAGKMFLMGHWSAMREITDPFRQSIDLYQLVFSQLRHDAGQWAAKLG